MSLKDRRQVTLSLAVPQLQLRAGSQDDLHTPNPFRPDFWSPTPNPPLVMTPDTPYLSLSPIETLEGKHGRTQLPWTEDEDGVLQSYLLQAASHGGFAPGELPPPGVVEDLAKQVLYTEARRGNKWTHDHVHTRERLFALALAESRTSIGGHRRTESESIIPSLVSSRAQPQPIARPQRPALAVLGGHGMSRQQHSMDSLYGDSDAEQTIETAQRLSSQLQGSTVASPSASGTLHSENGLSSPLSFTFPINMPTSCARKPSLSVHSPLPRPSPLSRGPSFTSADFPDSPIEESNDPMAALANAMHHAHSHLDGEVPPTSDSPVSESTLNSSPPSSMSSHEIGLDESEHMDLELELEEDPHTPITSTFGAILGLRSSPSGPVTPTDAPSITLTMHSPVPMAATTPRLPSAPKAPGRRLSDRERESTFSPQRAFAKLSLGPSPSPTSSSSSGSTICMQTPHIAFHAPTPNAPLQAPRRPASLAIRPVPLARSLSDSAATTPVRPLGAIATMPRIAEIRESKRQKAPGEPGGHVARLGGLAASGASQGGDLRSPFEHKPVSFADKMQAPALAPSASS